MKRLLSPYLLNVNVVIVGDSCVAVCTAARCRHSGGTPVQESLFFLHIPYTASDLPKDVLCSPSRNRTIKSVPNYYVLHKKSLTMTIIIFFDRGATTHFCLLVLLLCLASLRFPIRFTRFTRPPKTSQDDDITLSWFLIDASRR